MLDKAGDAVGEAVLIALVVEFDVEVVAGPALEDEVPDADLIGDVALRQDQLCLFACFLLDLLLEGLLLELVLLLRFVLLVHLLQPHRVNSVEVRHFLGLQRLRFFLVAQFSLTLFPVAAFDLSLGHAFAVEQLDDAIDSFQLHSNYITITSNITSTHHSKKDTRFFLTSVFLAFRFRCGF